MTRKPLALMLVLAVFVAGCGATPAEKVANGERIYAATARTTNLAIQNKVIKSPEVLKALDVANDEANDALADASNKVRADVPITNDFYLDRLNSALARWIDLLSKAGVK